MDALGYAMGALCFLIGTVFVYISPRNLRVPVLVFLGFYTITTLIGTILICATEGEVIDDSYGINMALLEDFGSPTFCFLLFCPMVVVPVAAYCFRNMFSRIATRIGDLDAHHEPASPILFCLVVSLFSLFCFYDLVVKGYGGSVFAWNLGDYMSMVEVRTNMFGALSSAFFGVIYSALPALTQYALYQVATTRTRGWKVALTFVMFISVFFCMAVVQKSILLVYLLFLGAGCYQLKLIRVRSILLMGLGLVFVLTGLQILWLGEWTFLQSVRLVIFRLAICFPFYVNIYPRILPHTGIDFGLHIVGLGSRLRDTFEVFEKMYPSIGQVEGSVAAPSHAKAYAQGGVEYAVLTLALIGVACVLISKLFSRIKGPIGYTLGMQSLVFLYYCSQTSLRESIISCYGIFWGIVALTPLIVISNRFGNRFAIAEMPNNAASKRDSSPAQAPHTPS